ncbi:MAG TPA: SCO family protein [Solirubrobacteraceae bacterium]|jgi:protein SCO1/2|nr:SCO family protein [Solirubrobacteraceae bacterium]
MRKRARSFAGLVLALALAATAVGCSDGSADTRSQASTSTQTAGSSGFDGAALPGGIQAPSFMLTDQSGRRVSLASYRGRVTIVAFVYSTCGAPCVVIAQQIRGALDELARPLPVLLISADPGADTPARVSSFLRAASLSGRVSYLSGTPAQLRPVWHAFRVVPASAHRAAFARSASVFLIDRAGHERVIFQLEQLTPEGLAHDVRKLLD